MEDSDRRSNFIFVVYEQTVQLVDEKLSKQLQRRSKLKPRIQNFLEKERRSE